MLRSRRAWIIAALLCLGTIVLYWRTTRFGFVDYDDPQYVTQNPIVQSGITLGGIKWALFSAYASNWHPVTWMSHMLDCELFGQNAAGPHFINILFHGLNTSLVFLVLLRLAGVKTSNVKLQTSGKPQAPSSKLGCASNDPVTCNLQPATRSALNPQPSTLNPLWPCAIIAALFAVHPLHVESVAWIAERKDVLSAFFFLLSIWAYVRYADAGRLNRLNELNKLNTETAGPQTTEPPQKGTKRREKEFQPQMNADERRFDIEHPASSIRDSELNAESAKVAEQRREDSTIESSKFRVQSFFTVSVLPFLPSPS